MNAMKISKLLPLLAATVMVTAVLLAPLPAFAQSCSLCYTQAAQSGNRMIEALKSGILILIAPPTLMSLGLVFICYRKRNQTRDFDSAGGEWHKEEFADNSSLDAED